MSYPPQLWPCPRCGLYQPSTDTSCPRCGLQLAKQPAGSATTAIVVAIVIVVGLLVLLPIVAIAALILFGDSIANTLSSIGAGL